MISIRDVTQSILTFIVICIAFSSFSYGYSGGIVGRTLKGPDPGCSCHNTNSSPGVNVVISGPSTLAPNQTATYNVTISGGPLMRAGVNIASSLGSLSPVSGSGLVLEANELKHSSPKSPSGGVVTFSFNYTAPPTIGTQTIYATANSVNFNGNSSGDQWNHASNFTINVSNAPVVDGNLDDSQYITIATKQNSNAGFGPNIDVSKIVYYPDVVNNNLYLGVVGKLNTGSNDGIGIWLNVSGTGSPIGTSSGGNLGGITGAGHYMGDPTNPDFKADFEVDYMFAINPGYSPTNCYVDAASRVGTPASVYLGDCGLTGSLVNYNTTGTVFSSGQQISFAFNNGGGANQGFEIRIPFAAIGANSSMSINVFAFVVSATAFFSDVTVPGNRTGDNPGFNANFSTMPGGPYNSGTRPLPVELTSFTAKVSGNNVILNWTTATELNNYGFDVERKLVNSFDGSGNWKKIAFIKGYGTTSSIQNYSFNDYSLDYGRYLYRLKQIDLDGSFNYSKEIEIEIVPISTFKLEQNYPNPFNPGTIISWQSPISGHQTLKVYDVLGNEVAILVDEYRDAGLYQYEFNASGFSSGVYFYKLQVGDYMQTKKMILLQ